MSNTLIKVFQREHGKYGYGPVGAITFANPLNAGRVTLNDSGEVYVLQPFATTLGDSCELVTINNGTAAPEAQPQLANATDLLQVRITQLPQVESQQTVVAPLDAETITHLLSRDTRSRSVVDAEVVAEAPKAIDEAATPSLWPPNEVKEAETNFAEVGLVPVMVGDNLFYINTTQAIDNNEPVVTHCVLPDLPSNIQDDGSLEKGNTVLSFVVDNPDQLNGVMPLSNLQQVPVVSTELPIQVAETPLSLLPQVKPVVKLKAENVAKSMVNSKARNGRSLLKGPVTMKQSRTTTPQTNLCLNKVKKGNKILGLPTILHKDISSSDKVFHPKIQMVANAENADQLGKQQQSLAVVAISSDKAKDLTEIVVNTSKGKQVFKGKTSDLINAMSALWCASNPDGTSAENQPNKTVENGESSEAEEEEEDEECDDQPVQDALNQLGTSLDSLLNVEDHSWRCPEQDCNKVFQRLHVLKVHILNHYGVRPYKCDYPRCKWAFFTHFRLKRHRETHLKKKDFKCPNPNCDRSFTTIYNLRTHQKLHQRPAVIECPVPDCSNRFQTKRHLEVHMREHGSDHAPFACPVESCDKRYYSLNSVNSHVRSHQHKEDDLRCQWAGCHKIFDKPCRLQAHMRTHTGDKPYQCNFTGCTWAFPSSSKLKRHQQKHTNTRNFACNVDGCGKLFMRPEHLREHVLTHSPVRLFHCTYNNCGLRFTAKSSLYVHMKKHRARDVPVDPLSTANSSVATGAAAAAAAAPPPTSADCGPPRQPSETRIVYYCPVENCDTSVGSMPDIRSHILEVHSPLLTQGDMMQLVSGLQPITFCDVPNIPHESTAQAAVNDEMVSAGQLSNADVNDSSVLTELLTSPHLAQQHAADPLSLVGQGGASAEATNECGALLMGTPDMKPPLISASTPKSPKEEPSGCCARIISYQSWRMSHPRSVEINDSREVVSSIDHVSCVTDVPGVPELRVPSDVVLGGALLGTGHDNIAHFLLSEDLGSSALYDSEEGMLTMDSPFEPSTINLRDLE